MGEWPTEQVNKRNNGFSFHSFGLKRKSPVGTLVHCLGVGERDRKWWRCCEKQFGSSSKKLNIALPYDLAIPLLGMYPEGLKAGTQEFIHLCS